MLYIPTCSISSTSPIPWYLHDVPTKYHGIYVWFNTDNSSMDLCELVQSIPMDTPKSGDRTKTHSFWWPNNVISRYPSFWDKPIHDMYTIHTYIYICYTYLHVAIVAPVSFFWWAMYPGDMQEPACCSYLILVSETSPASLLARRPCLLAIFLFAHPTSLSLFHDLLVLGLYTHVFRYWLPYISYIIVTKIKTAFLALISVSKFRWKITDMKVMSHNTPPYPNLTPPPSKL